MYLDQMFIRHFSKDESIRWLFSQLSDIILTSTAHLHQPTFIVWLQCLVETVNYFKKMIKQEVTENSISTFFNNVETYNFDNDSKLNILVEIQTKSLINKFNRTMNIAAVSETPDSTLS